MRKLNKDSQLNLLRIASASLLLVFVFSLVSPFFTFKAKQYFVRKEIKHRIKMGVPEKDMATFSFEEVTNDKSFSWEKENKEFHFKGKLYDIVRKEMCDGKTVVKCIDDTQEKCLFNDLDNMVQHTQSKDKNQHNYSIYFPLYEGSQIYILSLTVDSTEFSFTIKETVVKPGHSTVLAPPPNIHS